MFIWSSGFLIYLDLQRMQNYGVYRPLVDVLRRSKYRAPASFSSFLVDGYLIPAKARRWVLAWGSGEVSL